MDFSFEIHFTDASEYFDFSASRVWQTLRADLQENFDLEKKFKSNRNERCETWVSPPWKSGCGILDIITSE